MTLALWPSIDLSVGRVVRLLRGEAGSETVYESPAEDVIRRFETEGADGVHVVDLDAAFGRGENRALIGRLVRSVSIPVQVGGGLRDREAVDRALAAGAARAVVGSLPFQAPDVFARLVADVPDRLVVALDCKGGRPTMRGWTEDAGAGEVDAVAKRLGSLGTRALLVTDVARDGAMEGPNLALLSRVRAAFAREVIASGGMRGEEDLLPVEAALEGGARGAIFGRALHEGRTSVARLVAARVSRPGGENPPFCRPAQDIGAEVTR